MFVKRVNNLANGLKKSRPQLYPVKHCFANITTSLRCFTNLSDKHNLDNSYLKASEPVKLTVDDSEIDFFSSISAEWWDPYGKFKLLHKMNLPRVEYLQSRIQQFYPQSSSTSDLVSPSVGLSKLNILDVGCGGGLLCESLARLGAKVVGIDASQANINIARTHQLNDPLLCAEPKMLNYSCQTSHELHNEILSKKAPLFDIVCSLEVIEHVNRPQEFLQSISDLVKPQGLVFLSTISQNWFSRLLTIGLAEHVLNLTPVGTHHYEKFISPHHLVNLAKEAQLTTLNIQSLHFNPLIGQWLLGSEIDHHLNNSWLPPVNYIMVAIKQ